MLLTLGAIAAVTSPRVSRGVEVEGLATWCVHAAERNIALAERASEPYAKVRAWEITAENNKECAMKRLYGSRVADQVQGLIVP